MSHSPERINKRNEKLRERFKVIRKSNPKWTIIAVLDAVADEFYIEPTTVAKILKEDGEKVPCVDTVAKYHQLTLLY